ncbi:hypothetical protein C5167_021745 [Papaver somniferum]|uniref:Uncharacterized protein n=1 Tax=Papaver somniferum TaxID=3469 RepID=A0A4Y7JGV5_PAPSO|nr:hypothetical protein C5167_021745 [Papaver somniferum]
MDRVQWRFGQKTTSQDRIVWAHEFSIRDLNDPKWALAIEYKLIRVKLDRIISLAVLYLLSLCGFNNIRTNVIRFWDRPIYIHHGFFEQFPYCLFGWDASKTVAGGSFASQFSTGVYIILVVFMDRVQWRFGSNAGVKNQSREAVEDMDSVRCLDEYKSYRTSMLHQDENGTSAVR